MPRVCLGEQIHLQGGPLPRKAANLEEQSMDTERNSLSDLLFGKPLQQPAPLEIELVEALSLWLREARHRAAEQRSIRRSRDSDVRGASVERGEGG